MTERSIFLDESGDLGWTFDKPYREGGSSRFLTIACLSVASSSQKHVNRAMRDLYSHFGWPPAVEKKWARMTPYERLSFAELAKSLHKKLNGEISYLSITARKERVRENIRKDSNKLYNWMIGKLILGEIAPYERVAFIPDQRSLKVQSGNSLHDYLQTVLWMDMDSQCTITTRPCDSAKNLNVQFADMLSGLVQGHYEDRKSDPILALRPYIKNFELFNQ